MPVDQETHAGPCSYASEARLSPILLDHKVIYDQFSFIMISSLDKPYNVTSHSLVEPYWNTKRTVS